MNITLFLNSRGFSSFEGNTREVHTQVEDLIRLTSKPNIKVMEIGFNAGHSAELFLSNNKSLSLVSFDLGVHDYVNTAKEYIDFIYPNRHKLILGDSTKTVPEFTDAKFDFIFIDGGHEYEIAKADMENCRLLSHADTVVALDDTMYTRGWEQAYTIGPTKTWTEQLSQGKVIELNRKDYCIGRGMSWGKYVI
jgi:predicted O-methyltransferase YrrM